MLKILPIIPSNTSQNVFLLYYSYFILISLPIIPMLFFMVYFSGIHIQRNMELIYSYYVIAIV